LSAKGRIFSAEFKVAVVRRILNGENLSALQREVGIKRSVLYRWRDAYQKEGAAGLSRPRGRPPGVPSAARAMTPAAGSPGEDAASQKVAMLERKIGRQALEIDFLQRAFKRVKELRQQSSKAGGTASTERSGE
jgi:transposase-like protein